MLTAFADSEYGCLREVLLCPPSDANGGTENIAFPNLRDAMRQHENLVAVLESEGIRCRFMSANPDMPYQSYMRDSYAITPWGLLLARMGFEPRSDEPKAVEKFALKAGIPIWQSISEGSLEGGDVQLLRPGYAVVGSNGDRTTAAAAQQVKGWFEDKGWACRIIQYPPGYRHLDTAMGVIDSGNIICCEGVFSHSDHEWFESLNFQLHTAPQEEAANMVCNTVSLGKKRVLSCSQNKYGNPLLEKLGFQVLDVDISQFVRDSGGIHCLVNPILRDPAHVSQCSPIYQHKMEPRP